MDAVSKLALLPAMAMGCEMADKPEMEAWPDRMLEPAESGLFSGNRAFTKVSKSAGLMTKYGWTSTVSLKDVMDLAGSSLAAGTLDRAPWNLGRRTTREA